MSLAQVLTEALQRHRQGAFAEAARLYRQVLRSEPRQPDALHLLGLMLCQTGDPKAGIPLLRDALAIQPDFAEAHYNLANVLRDAGDLRAAVPHFQEAVRCRPSMAEAHFNLANTLRDLGELQAALESYDAAIRARPAYAKAHTNRGAVLSDLQQWSEAACSFQESVRLEPHSSLAHNNLSNAWRQSGHLTAAEVHARQAVQLDPLHPEAHNNLGAVLNQQGRTAEALACFETAISLRPDYAKAHLNRALNWLGAGRFREGWREYEWRWQCPDHDGRVWDRPRWDGSPLQGRTILVHAEQGLGDTLQFVRFLPLVKMRGAIVVLECDARLHRLFHRCAGIDRLVARGEPLPGFDVQLPLMSLPAVLHTDLASIPSETYLSAEPELVAYWERELAFLSGFRVGVNWQGNPRSDLEKYRAIPVEQVLGLARIPGVQLISLQRAVRRETSDPEPGGLLFDLAPRLDEQGSAFTDSAAVMQNLDLVISSDTALAHLAGALGVPVWVALPFAAEWRWLTSRNDSPWYPSMRLFRQPAPGDWTSVFEQIANALTEARGARRARGG